MQEQNLHGKCLVWGRERNGFWERLNKQRIILWTVNILLRYSYSLKFCRTTITLPQPSTVLLFENSYPMLVYIYQGFLNSSKGLLRGGGGKFPCTGGGGGSEILLEGGIFYWVEGTWGVILTIWTFFKVFCEYWTSLKIKISMTGVSKKSEIKTKIVEEPMTAAKSYVFVLFLFFFFGGGDWVLEGGGINIS